MIVMIFCQALGYTKSYSACGCTERIGYDAHRKGYQVAQGKDHGPWEFLCGTAVSGKVAVDVAKQLDFKKVNPRPNDG